MKNEKWATAAAREKNDFDSAKVTKVKDIIKVLEFFRYTIGTSLDCAHATGILRNSVTYYISDLEDEGVLRAICRKRDTTTHYPAKHYSADKTEWTKQPKVELSLFGKEAAVWS